MKSYFAAWHDPNAYYTSHLGWGMNPRARWDTLIMFDRNDTNGTEQRAFAGNFLFSTGSNRFANRFTEAHFDLPMRNCTVELDGRLSWTRGISFPNCNRAWCRKVRRGFRTTSCSNSLRIDHVLNLGRSDPNSSCSNARGKAGVLASHEQASR